MPNRISVSLDGPIAVVQIDNPPVNALSRDVRDQLQSTLERLAADRAIRAVVVIGAGRTFVAGADIKELEETAWNPSAEPPDLHPLLAGVEGSRVPVVMAIHGSALGGGLELAMAGHYRVAVPDARLGLPEVNLGIIPGGEGTARLPRLVGVGHALGMCVSGQPVGGAEAHRIGLVDRVADGELLAGAVAFAREVMGEPPTRTRDRT